MVKHRKTRGNREKHRKTGGRHRKTVENIEIQQKNREKRRKTGERGKNIGKEEKAEENR